MAAAAAPQLLPLQPPLALLMPPRGHGAGGRGSDAVSEGGAAPRGERGGATPAGAGPHGAGRGGAPRLAAIASPRRPTRGAAAPIPVATATGGWGVPPKISPCGREPAAGHRDTGTRSLPRRWGGPSSRGVVCGREGLGDRALVSPLLPSSEVCAPGEAESCICRVYLYFASFFISLSLLFYS